MSACPEECKRVMGCTGLDGARLLELLLLRSAGANRCALPCCCPCPAESRQYYKPKIIVQPLLARGQRHHSYCRNLWGSADNKPSEACGPQQTVPAAHAGPMTSKNSARVPTPSTPFAPFAQVSGHPNWRIHLVRVATSGDTGARLKHGTAQPSHGAFLGVCCHGFGAEAGRQFCSWLQKLR